MYAHPAPILGLKDSRSSYQFPLCMMTAVLKCILMLAEIVITCRYRF